VGHFTPEDSWNKITISLENVSVKEALRHLFPYSVGTSVVSVGYDHVCEGALIKKIYLPNGLFLLGSDAPGLMHMRTYDVSKQFEDRGVNFGLGGSAVYQVDEILNP